MGYGGYSYESHQAIVQARSATPQREVFAQRSVHPLMNPLGAGIRESRDSAEHPNSVPIFFALDVTGSMGQIPDSLARRRLPGFMKALIAMGINDPQILFTCVGDSLCDSGPLQVGQFESTAQDIDRWLTWSWLEGGGGGNGCESYELAIYFAARHTETDSIVKRGKRGYFFMTGDENPYPEVDKGVVRNVIGDILDDNISLTDICQELSHVYHPFFLIPDPTRAARCQQAWTRALGDHVIVMEDPEDTCYVASALVALCEGVCTDVTRLHRGLRDQGLGDKRIGSILRAVTPYAATLGYDGNRAPQLTAVLP